MMDTYIIDGNHRVTAKLRRIEQGLDDNCWMMAQIYEDLPLDREAEVFTKVEMVIVSMRHRLISSMRRSSAVIGYP